MLYLYNVIDLFLMPFMRFPDSSIVGYLLGIFILCLGAVLIGELSINLAFQVNRKRITRDTNEINHFQDMSFHALKSGDKEAFRACNSIANEAYGRSFFSQLSLSAASLWPLFIALGWMHYRFSEVEFTLPLPLFKTELKAGYLLTFALCYIITRILFSKIKKVMRSSKARAENAETAE